MANFSMIIIGMILVQPQCLLHKDSIDLSVSGKVPQANLYFDPGSSFFRFHNWLVTFFIIMIFHFLEQKSLALMAAASANIFSAFGYLYLFALYFRHDFETLL